MTFKEFFKNAPIYWRKLISFLNYEVAVFFAMSNIYQRDGIGLYAFFWKGGEGIHLIIGDFSALRKRWFIVIMIEHYRKMAHKKN